MYLKKEELKKAFMENFFQNVWDEDRCDSENPDLEELYEFLESELESFVAEIHDEYDAMLDDHKAEYGQLRREVGEWESHCDSLRGEL